MGLRRSLRGLGSHPLVHNAVGLYGIQVATLAVPLITIPYLARVLGPVALGALAFSQGFGQFLTLVVDYGFALSGTREIAQNREDAAARGRILGGVQGAKVVLSLGAVAVAVLCFFVIPIFNNRPEFLIAATAWGIAQGFSPTWYFQGIERLRLAAGVEVGGRVLATIAIFASVSVPSDAWKVLVWQMLAAVLTLVVTGVLLRRDVRALWPTKDEIVATLRLGGSMFFFRSAVSLYTVANVFLLGLLAAPAAVGYFAGAEKITRAIVALFTPISQTVFPRISALITTSRTKAAELTTRTLVLVGALGLLTLIALFAGAAPVIRIALGSEFEGSVWPLRLMAALPLLIGISSVLGIQWMVPLRLDWTFNKIVLLGGGLNLVLALVLGSAFEADGMAVAVVATELVITAGIYAALRLRRLLPWHVSDTPLVATQGNL